MLHPMKFECCPADMLAATLCTTDPRPLARLYPRTRRHGFLISIRYVPLSSIKRWVLCPPPRRRPAAKRYKAHDEENQYQDNDVVVMRLGAREPPDSPSSGWLPVHTHTERMSWPLPISRRPSPPPGAPLGPRPLSKTKRFVVVGRA